MSVSPYSSSSSTCSDEDDNESTTTWSDDHSSTASGTPAPHIPVILSYSLKSYLETVWLPTFRSRTAPEHVAPGRTRPWPPYKEMQRPVGTRGLQAVVRIEHQQFNEETSGYFHDLPVIMMDCDEDGESPDLMLPNPDLVVMEIEDRDRLCNIEGKDQFAGFISAYLLRTVTEALRLIHGLPRNVPLARHLEFCNDASLPGVGNPLWEMFYLPSAIPDKMDLVFVCVAPWDFGGHDFQDFAAEQFFQNGDLDTFHTREHDACDKLWAAIYDFCRGQCHYFVVTTYECWAFGRFSDDWSVALLTSSLVARIREFYTDYSPVKWEGRNLVEMLIYWIQVSRGAANPIEFPELGPRELRIMKREMMRECQSQ